MLKGPHQSIQESGHRDRANAADYFRGHFKSQQIIRDPFVSGYSFIKWLAVPSWVEQDEYADFKAASEKNFRAFSGISSIDLNTFALNEGFSNTENMFAGGAQMFQGFSITHNEYSGSPIRNMYTKWVSGIRDPVTNMATYPKEYNLEYTAKNHSGDLLYVVTRPDANNVEKKTIIEFSCLYTLVMPTRIALDHLNYTAGSNDPVQIEMAFTGVPHISPAVDELAGNQLASMWPAGEGTETLGGFTPLAAT